MPKYLFTSDQRISQLLPLIKKVATLIDGGGSVSSIADKSENNNAATLKFYYNLQEGTEICNLAASNPILAVRNFVLKFQFPNVRTPESFRDSLSEHALFAPFRTVVKTLYKMAEKSSDGSSSIGFDEILYYMFCNDKVYCNPSVDYDLLVTDILNGRNARIDLATLISGKLQWKQYGRQIGELMTVLSYSSEAFNISKRTIYFSLNSKGYKDDKEYIDSILQFKYIWYPSNPTDFTLSTKEYTAFMDTKLTSFNVIDLSSVGSNKRKESSPNDICGCNKIYFGSPGTGKSFKVNSSVLEGVSDEFVFRTTFHPDTDYASFVGCYKPVCHKGSHSVAKTHSLDDLAEILKEEYAKADIKTLALHSFAFKYADYFNGNIASYSKKDLVLKAGLTEDYKEEINKIVNLYNWMLKNEYVADCDTITYRFSPQTFTNAYIKAWQNPTENVYLVIEEINRGNCAQIFGDLFQLLDRNDDGVSEYPIKADADLAKYLKEVLGEDHEGIADEKIKLPANLYILATMNTSDQSLFPMDSAFKRRWEWKYVPTSVIGDKKKTLQVESKEETVLLNREQEKKVLRLGMYEYDWSVFLEKINKCITDATHSDDKQLGFWFVKTPKDSNLINIETFVSKVIFYLWTDVFKDFGAKATNPFAFKNAEGGWVVCPFSSFFDPYTGEINLGQIHGFMYNLGIIPELEPEIQAAIEKNIVEEGNPEA